MNNSVLKIRTKKTTVVFHFVATAQEHDNYKTYYWNAKNTRLILEYEQKRDQAKE